MANEPVPQSIREEWTVRKFGGADPDACREEDLEEETTVVIEHGVVVSVLTTRPASPAPKETQTG